MGKVMLCRDKGIGRSVAMEVTLSKIVRSSLKERRELLEWHAPIFLYTRGNFPSCAEDEIHELRDM